MEEEQGGLSESSPGRKAHTLRRWAAGASGCPQGLGQVEDGTISSRESPAQNQNAGEGQEVGIVWEVQAIWMPEVELSMVSSEPRAVRTQPSRAATQERGPGLWLAASLLRVKRQLAANGGEH